MSFGYARVGVRNFLLAISSLRCNMAKERERERSGFRLAQYCLCGHGGFDVLVTSVNHSPKDHCLSNKRQ